MDFNKDSVRRYMRTLRDEERFGLGLNLTEVIESCTFGSLPCNLSDPNEIHIYSSPLYGNCFTFNPAFEDAKAKQATPDDFLRLQLRFPSRGFWLPRRSRSKIAVHFHSPGSAPIMESAEVEDLFDENAPYLAVLLESELISIKKRATAVPSCVDSNDEAYQRRSVYYSEKTPYKYSLEACLKSCKAGAFRKCGYLYPYIPVQSEEYEKGANLSYSTGSDCNRKPINMEACNCPIPCRKIQYRVLRDENELFDIPCDQKSLQSRQIKSHSQKNERKIDEYDSESQVTINIRSSVYQSIEEQLAHGLYEYLGILGGNMSLWIGLCIISLLEVVELCIKVILAYIRSFQNQP